MTTPPPEPPVTSARTPRIRFDSAQELKVATTVGVALLSAATALSAAFSREGDGLDGSVFTVGLVAAGALLLVGLAARFVIPNAEDHTLVSWPGAAGIVGFTLMLAVGLDDGKSTQYICSLLLIALSILGYLLARSAPFVLSGILGLGLLYLRLFDDIFDFSDGDNDNTIMLVGAAVVVFVFVVTIAGWFLPRTRILTAVSVGAAGVVGIVGVLELGLFFGSITTSFASMSSSDDGFSASGGVSDMGDDFGRFVQHNPYVNDIYVVLGYAVALAALWSVLALITGHVGFRLLTVAILVLSTPMAAVALMTKHPTWWAVIAGLLGGAVLLGAAFLAKVSYRTATSATPPAQ